MSVIRFENVSKIYNIGPGSYGTLRDHVAVMFQRIVSRRPKPVSSDGNSRIWALKDVSFEVAKGESFGIIGPNGAGKSTILKLLAGITMPTHGRRQVSGRIAPLIELGAGFHPELTGRENVFINGTILGMKQSEIKNKFDSIIAFSELEQFVDVPLKKYSSGMYARLGFSIAIHTEPEILLVDEVLAVGDWPFQAKCFERMDRFCREGTTLVFVSHNMDVIKRMCPKTILLNKGGIEINGQTTQAIDTYYKLFSQDRINYVSGETKAASIDGVELLNASGKSNNTFRAGDMALLRYWVTFYEEAVAPEFGFFIKRPDQVCMVSTGSKDLGIAPEQCKKGSRYKIEFNFDVNLLKGIYHIGVEVRDRRFKDYYDYIDRAITIMVQEDYAHGGYTHLNPRCRLTPEAVQG